MPVAIPALLRFVSAVASLILSAHVGFAQNAPSSTPLVDLERPAELRLAAGETKSLRVHASAGEYLRLVVTPDPQLAIKTSLFDPAGQLIAVTPSLGGTGGLARIAAYAEASGDFRLDVTSQVFLAESRLCTITLTVRRPAGDQDRLDAQAHREFAKAAAQANSGAADMKAALALLDEPIELARAAGDTVLEMRAVFGKGQFHAMLGDLQGSLPFFTASLDLCRKAGDLRAEAHTLDDIGLVTANLERYNDAIGWYNRALQLLNQTGQPWETALALANLADAQSALGRIDLALESLQRQEEIRRRIGDEFGLSQTWLGMADVYLMTGDPEHALEKLIDTLPYWPRFRDKEDGKESEIAAYRKLGLAYMSLGDYDAASTALQKGVTLARALGNKRVIADTLVAEAQFAPMQGHPARAIQISRNALAASRGAEYRRGEALSLMELAQLQIAAGQARAALAPLEQALRITEDLSQPYDEANARRASAAARAALGERTEAARQYEAALAIERRIGDRFGEVQTLVDAARLDDRAGNTEEALSKLDKALAVIDQTRASLAAPELRTRYLASQRAAYEFSARILMRLDRRDPDRGYGLRAFEISERAHARTLLDALGAARGPDPERTPQLNALDASLHRIASQEDLPTARREARVAELLAARSQLELQLRRTGSSAAAAESVPLSLAAIRQQALGGDAVLLEYLTGAQQGHLWVVSRSKLQHYDLPGEAVLGAAVRRLYDALTAADRMPSNLTASARQAALAAADESAVGEARALAQTLLPMPASMLEDGPVLIVADGPLQMVPFAFLPQPGDTKLRLGNRHAIAIEPSASVLARMREARKPSSDGRILIVADPVYGASDSRTNSGKPANGAPLVRTAYSAAWRDALGGRLDSLPRLPMSRVEAEHIARLAPNRTTTLLDFEAAPATFEHAAADRFAIIHVAAHTLLDDRHPELSGLVFSLVDRQKHRQDGLLRLLDIYKLRLNAGLVVLSACETYVGKDLRGEGLLGLARGFLLAGARQVVASVWKVDDRATAIFMEKFYTALLRDHLSTSAALRHAQNEMAVDPAWQSPRYWAGFVLEGDAP